ncbi:MAG: DNA recombination protein RmuC [Deltaproteobacteria bacterium]|nr:DNA recombination protein RmuC [Deltaproteobacteria bacterium]
MTELYRAFSAFIQDTFAITLSNRALLPFLSGLTALLFLLLTLTLIRSSGLKRQLRETKKLSLLAEEERVAAKKQHVKDQIRVAKLITLIKNERKHGAEKLTLLEKAREELSMQFSTLAQQVLEEKSAKFDEIGREKLESILHPFSHQLQSFKNDINDIYLNDTRERTSLKKEILQLRELNQQINQEAINLTRALKQDTKQQGNWGELVLERVLEQSGLRRGHEYETQGGFRDHDNRLMKPDVIIHLPGKKDIVVDSKVSLISWERYVNSEQENDKSRHLAGLTKAVREHVSQLAEKNYPALTGIRSLDFVLMFMPIEAAFAAVCQHNDQIFTDALAKKIVVVTPTTLLATMRTIENIWQYEHQNKNSVEIARKATIMYDKFRSFAEEMEKIGRQLATCHTTYDSAMTKLTRGRGNLISHAEQLRELGIQVKRPIPPSIMEISDLDQNETEHS